MNKALLSLTAADLMSRELVLVPQEMSLQGAARMLTRAQVSGAPVVDDMGKCIGVLSATDILHWVDDGVPRNRAKAVDESVCHSWKIFGNDASPTDCVSGHMTGDPVVVRSSVGIGDLAQMMMDARIHRVIVVDHGGRPVGIVSSTDILAAVAREARANETVAPATDTIQHHVSG
jgi:predicted transcriptional regulator